jgi:predicted nucleotidyltransferase
MVAQQLVAHRRGYILRLAAQHGATNVRVFGSVVRGEASAGSDIDFLVDMEPKGSLLDIATLKLDRQDLLGCDVDVVTESSLYWLLRRRILREARPV